MRVYDKSRSLRVIALCTCIHSAKPQRYFPMEISFSTRSEAVPASGVVTIYHGSALGYCDDIANTGLDYERMKAACAGSYAFCTSLSSRIAIGYAHLNPLVVVAGHLPGLIKLDLPHATVQELRAMRLASWVPEDQAYEFLPETFARIDLEKTAVSVIPITNATVTFEE